MPGWRADERAFAMAQGHKPVMMVVAPQYGIIRAGFEAARAALENEGLR